MTDIKTLKIAVLGTGGVGKTALTIRFQKDVFSPEYDPTIEDRYRHRRIVDGKQYYFDILDTAGQQEFQQLHDEWIKSADGFLVVYDITSRNTFQELQRFLDQLLRLKDEELDTVGVVLAGNKCDLSASRQVSLEEGKSLVEFWKKKGLRKWNFMKLQLKIKLIVLNVFIKLQDL